VTHFAPRDKPGDGGGLDENGVAGGCLPAKGRTVPDALEGYGQPFGMDRLEQIIERIALEIPHGITVKSGDKHHKRAWDSLLLQFFHVAHVIKPGFASQFDVEKSDIGPVFRRKRKSAFDIARLPGDFYIRMLRKKIVKLQTRWSFVIDDQA